jgi:hypothetical protein
MTVWMKHPNIEDLIEVPDAAVPGHMLSGWRITDPPPRPKTADELIEEAQAGAEPVLEPGAKYAAAVESRPENQSAEDGKEK